MYIINEMIYLSVCVCFIFLLNGIYVVSNIHQVEYLSAIARSHVEEFAFTWLLGTAGGRTRIIFNIVQSLIVSCQTVAEQQLVEENAGEAIAE